MGMFEFRWLRLLIRRNTYPIPVARAEMWRKRLAIGYAVLAWNAFGLVCYMCYNGKADWAKYYGLKDNETNQMTPAQQWTKTLGIKTAKVYRISGLNVIEYDIDNEKDEPKTVQFVEKLKEEAKTN